MNVADLQGAAGLLRTTSAGYQEIARSLVTAAGYVSLPPQFRDQVEGSLGRIESNLQWLSGEFEEEAVDLECRADLAAQPGEGLASLVCGGPAMGFEASSVEPATATSPYGLSGAVANGALGAMLIGSGASVAPAVDPAGITISAPAYAPPVTGASILIGGGTVPAAAPSASLIIGSGYSPGIVGAGGSISIPISAGTQAASMGAISVGSGIGVSPSSGGFVSFNPADLTGSLAAGGSIATTMAGSVYNALLHNPHSPFRQPIVGST